MSTHLKLPQHPQRRQRSHPARTARTSQARGQPVHRGTGAVAWPVGTAQTARHLECHRMPKRTGCRPKTGCSSREPPGDRHTPASVPKSWARTEITVTHRMFFVWPVNHLCMCRGGTHEGGQPEKQAAPRHLCHISPRHIDQHLGTSVAHEPGFRVERWGKGIARQHRHGSRERRDDVCRLASGFGGLRHLHRRALC